MADGVHLTDVGKDLFILGLKEGIEQALFFLGGGALHKGLCEELVAGAYWVKGSRLQPSDQIHVSMGLVNIFLQCTAIAGFLMTLNPSFLGDYMINMTFIILSFFLLFSFWLNTCLCAYYLTCIANFNHRLFTWLKTNLSVLTPKLILVAAVGSFILSFSGIGKINLELITENSTTDSGITSFKIHTDPLYSLISNSLGCFVPCILSSLCLGYTVMCILKHVWRIKNNDSGFTRPNLQAHIRAARTMVLLIMLSLSLILAQTLNVAFLNNGLDIILISIFMNLLFPSGQAFIVIQASAKLRQVFQLRGCLGNVCIEKPGIQPLFTH
uniref:Taste receptor type 2 n=1 Tax=Leptobrachium leishanense TaxID=445787 RepID=A0A8C5QEG8_9ANUR